MSEPGRSERARCLPRRRIGAPRAMLVLYVLVMLLGLGWSGPARANPDLRWRTLTTEHFVIHYHDQHARIAEVAAAQAERAWAEVGERFGHVPRRRTHIVLRDDTDTANGSATAVPFPRISLNVAAPDSMSVLGNYDDWLDILVTHEFVHIAHLDTTRGIPRLMNLVFGLGGLGNIYTPNIIQPRWIIEGIATFYESDLGSQGRGRFDQFEMFLRMAVIEGRLQGLDQVTNAARIAPYASTVYLYGLHFMRYLVLTYGRDSFEKLSHVYGGRLIPFGINRALQDVIGIGFDELWRDFLEDSRVRYRGQARKIRSRGLRQGRRITFSANGSPSRGHARYPAWSAEDQWIYFFDDDGHSRPGVRRVARQGAALREGFGIGEQGRQRGVERVFDAANPTPVALVGGGPSFVFDMPGLHDLRYQWSDLYLWRPGDDPLDGGEQLTFGLRAREPHVSPDGRTVVFVRGDVGQTRLAFMDLDSLTVREVAPTERLQQVYTPRFSPDGARVVYSRWGEGGYRDLYLRDVATGDERRLTVDRAMNQSPCWSADGAHVVFSSDRSGVFNLYAIHLDSGEVRQVTNVLGGAFECAVSHDGETLAYVGFTASGYDLWTMQFDPDAWTEPLPATMAYPAAPRLDEAFVDAATDGPDAAPRLDGPGGPDGPDGADGVSGGEGARKERRGGGEVGTRRRYQPWRTFYPRVIMPTAFEFSSSDFLTDIGISTQLSDVVGLHSLAGTFRWLVDYQRPAGSVQWVWRRPFPTFSASFGRTFRERGGYDRFLYDGGEDDRYLDQAYLERSTSLSARMSLPIFSHPIHRASATFGYDFTRYDNLDAVTVVDPNAPAQRQPEVGDLAGVRLGLAYSNTRANTFSYYSETGRRISTNLSVFDRALGGDFGDIQASVFYSEFIPMPWRGHQVLALRLSGGISAGGVARRGAFSLGGMSEQQDQFRLLLTRTAVSEAGSLRGYPAGVFRGQRFGLLNVEYRIPLVDVERGLGSVPAYLQNVVLVPFTDWGMAWDRDLSLDDLAGSVGASLVFAFRLGYGERIDLFFQYARGLDPEVGLDLFRVLVARSF